MRLTESSESSTIGTIAIFSAWEFLMYRAPARPYHSDFFEHPGFQHHLPDRHLSARVRALADDLYERFSDRPYWDLVG